MISLLHTARLPIVAGLLAAAMTFGPGTVSAQPPSPPNPPAPPATASLCAQYLIAYTNGVYYYETGSVGFLSCTAPFGTGFSDVSVATGCYNGCPSITPLILKKKSLKGKGALVDEGRHLITVNDYATAVDALQTLADRLEHLRTYGGPNAPYLSPANKIRMADDSMSSRRQLRRDLADLVTEWQAYMTAGSGDPAATYAVFRDNFPDQYDAYYTHFYIVRTGARGRYRSEPDAVTQDEVTQTRLKDPMDQISDPRRRGRRGPYYAEVDVNGTRVYFEINLIRGRSFRNSAQVTIGQQISAPPANAVVYPFQLKDGFGHSHVILFSGIQAPPARLERRKLIVSTVDELDLWMHELSVR